MASRIELPVEEVVSRYRAGETTYALAHAYGVGQMTIARRLWAAGVKMRSGHRGWPHKHKRGGPLHACRKGYLRTNDREGKRCIVHRGCWEAYHGTIPAEHDIHHINGDILDNRIGNLACMSHIEHLGVRRERTE